MAMYTLGQQRSVDVDNAHVWPVTDNKLLQKLIQDHAVVLQILVRNVYQQCV